jgi:hypothetical protein
MNFSLTHDGTRDGKRDGNGNFAKKTKKKIPFFTPKLPDNPKCIHSELISKSKGTKAGKSLCQICWQ